MIKSPTLLTRVNSIAINTKPISRFLKRLSAYGLGAVLALFMLSCGQASDSKVASKNGIILEMELDQTSRDLGQVVLNSTLTNFTGQPITFFPWNTPFDNAVNGRFLSIIDSATNTQLAYQGRLVKRRAPMPEDYRTLAHGEAAFNSLDISKSYNFCADKRYIIRLLGSIYDDQSEILPIHVNSVEIQLGDEFRKC